MYEAVAEAVAEADALIMAAAVADYRPMELSETKIKKGTAALTLKLERTPDILGDVSGDFIKVGFAAESENLIENAKQKLHKKQLDLIVANDITATDSGFGVDSDRVVVISSDGKADSLPLLPKRQVADRILDKVVELLAKR
jgi:phosphopantothenoylcysteine decarboxylase/phosphopantothenate--cysteine ligase